MKNGFWKKLVFRIVATLLETTPEQLDAIVEYIGLLIDLEKERNARADA